VRARIQALARQIISPPWDREARKAEFPSRFETIDVPALKLEADNRLVCATQDPGLISEMLVQLKWMLINRHGNDQIAEELVDFMKQWKGQPSPDACAIGG
jgi:hypothetical protein